VLLWFAQPFDFQCLGHFQSRWIQPIGSNAGIREADSESTCASVSGSTSSPKARLSIRLVSIYGVHIAYEEIERALVDMPDGQIEELIRISKAEKVWRAPVRPEDRLKPGDQGRLPSVKDAARRPAKRACNCGSAPGNAESMPTAASSLAFCQSRLSRSKMSPNR